MDSVTVSLAAGVAVILLCVAGCAPRPEAGPAYPTRRVENPHYVGDARLSGVEASAGQDPRMLEQEILRRAEVEVVEDVPASNRWRLVTASPGERYVAFVVHEPQPRLYVKDQREGEGGATLTVTGLPHGDKPIIGLLWEEGGALSFQRWSDPGAGMAYLLDVEGRRLVAAKRLRGGKNGGGEDVTEVLKEGGSRGE